MASDQRKDLIITFTCVDKPGLVHEITSVFADLGMNIVDINQSVVRGIFSIILLCDPSTSSLPVDELMSTARKRLEALQERTGGYLLIDDASIRSSARSATPMHVKVTVLGKDAPGIVSKVSGVVFTAGFNIESITMVSRKELFAMEMILNSVVDKVADPLGRMKQELKRSIDKDRLSVIIDDRFFSQEKKLVVFDMDSTLIREECIDELGGALNIKEKIATITRKAMNGEVDFKEALRERVHLLKGVHESVLQDIASRLTLTPGAADLIATLKRMGYTVALISGGFSFFTNILKHKLDLDYAFGNELIIENGRLTGEVNENMIIDAKQKAKIQAWIAQIQKVPMENIVTIGDGANDAIMIQNSGLGIGFKPKEMLKDVADGIINEDNLIGIMYALGDLRRRKILDA